MRSGTTSGGHIVAYTMFWFMLQRMCFVSTSPPGSLNAADGLALIEEYLGRGAVHPHLAAHAAEAFEQSCRQLVAGLVGYPRAVVYVQPEHVDVLEEGQMVSVDAEIAPVGVHYILRELRHLHCPEHTVDRVAAQPQEVGEVLLHILRVCLARDAQRVVAGGVKLRAEVEQILYGFAAAGHQDAPSH